jgi:DUF4097 and DUF4098 domain-containing protein YvlB
MRRMTVLAFVLLVATAASAASDRTLHKTARLDANGRLTIDTHNGSVTVTTWDRPEVDIQARIEAVIGVSESDVNKTDVRVSGSGGSVTVKTDYEEVNGFNIFGGQTLPPVHYTITMPATAELKVSTHNAATRVRGLRNDVEVDTHNGPVDIAGLDGGARIETHNGSVHLAFARFARSTRIDTHNGSIELQIPQGSAFRIDAEGHHLSFDSDFAATTRGLDSDRFTGDVNGGGPALRISTHNGSVRIRKS